jgi:predicted SpoU family rRNA methylase
MEIHNDWGNVALTEIVSRVSKYFETHDGVGVHVNGGNVTTSRVQLQDFSCPALPLIVVGEQKIEKSKLQLDYAVSVGSAKDKSAATLCDGMELLRGSIDIRLALSPKN